MYLITKQYARIANDSLLNFSINIGKKERLSALFSIFKTITEGSIT